MMIPAIAAPPIPPLSPPLSVLASRPGPAGGSVLGARALVGGRRQRAASTLLLLLILCALLRLGRSNNGGCGTGNNPGFRASAGCASPPVFRPSTAPFACHPSVAQNIGARVAVTGCGAFAVRVQPADNVGHGWRGCGGATVPVVGGARASATACVCARADRVAAGQALVAVGPATADPCPVLVLARAHHVLARLARPIGVPVVLGRVIDEGLRGTGDGVGGPRALPRPYLVGFADRARVAAKLVVSDVTDAFMAAAEARAVLVWAAVNVVARGAREPVLLCGARA
jgi:hypothetical protein